MAQTAVEWLVDKLFDQDYLYDHQKVYIEMALRRERQILQDAMMYALDEDGHTGDWKIKFINDYYESNFRVRPERP